MRLDLRDSLRPNVGCEREYSVAFDPLDGSSIIDANFSVGSVCCALSEGMLTNAR